MMYFINQITLEKIIRFYIISEKKCNSINMVGDKTISLATSLGIGSEKSIRRIEGIPFLIVFKM